MPDKPTFGGGADETILHPAVLIAMLVILLLTLVLPRRWVIVPLLLGVFLIPLNQQIFVLGVHWFVIRIIILMTLVRVIILRFISGMQIFSGGFNLIDRTLFLYVICIAVATVLLFQEMPALINQFGFLIDFLGGYTILRAFIRDEVDVRRAIQCLAVLAVIVGIFTIREQLTGMNSFGLLGGVPLYSEIRDDKLRAQACFQHPLTAGAFGATSLGLFLYLWVRGRSKAFAILGIMGATAITICTNSSTPLLAYMATILGICLWPLRKKMKSVRWGIVIMLVGLQMVMKAPVWFLIARVDLTGSSTGYHRAELVDQFINHFSDWWLIGTKDAGTWGEDLWDTQNEFVSVGETGGLLAFIFFVTMVSRAFAKVGNARAESKTRNQEWGVWLVGAALFSNIAAFFGVNYFDQSKMAWFMLLAIICAVSGTVSSSQRTKIGKPNKEERLPGESDAKPAEFAAA